MSRTYLLSALALPAALVLVSCDDSLNTVTEEDFDAGLIECASGFTPRFGKCWCNHDSACKADEYCHRATGECREKPAVEEPDAGEPPHCVDGKRRCAPAPKKAIQECQDAEWIDVETCPESGYCAESATGRYCAICTPGMSRCKAGAASTLETCSDKGDKWVESPCAKDPDTQQPAACVNDKCQVCTPNKERCSGDGKFLETCADDGSGWSRYYCPITGKCAVTNSVPGCVAPVCTPGATECKDGFVISTCKQDGSGWEDKDCRSFDQYATAEAKCSPQAGDPLRKGFCEDPCGNAAREFSYQGCEYWAAVTTNSELDPAFKGNTTDGAQNDSISYFAVVISNPNSVPVNVKVRRKTSAGEVDSKSEPAHVNGYISVPANGQQIIRLPWQVVSGTGVKPYAYHITSNLPVSAYQFNPVVAYTGSAPQLDWMGSCSNCSYTNDGSLLIPAHILGSEYVVLGQEHQSIGSSSHTQIPAFFSVVAVEDNTQVMIRFSAATVASTSGTSIPAQTKNSVKTYVLNKYDVLQFLSAPGGTALQTVDSQRGGGEKVSRYPSDPTGTLIFASDSNDPNKKKPVAVFSGADCTFKPFNKFACDHIEEMMVPFPTWGRSFVGTRSVPYMNDKTPPQLVSRPELDYWRVVSGCGKSRCPNGTNITIAPAPTAMINGSCTPLAPAASSTCKLPPIDTAAGQPTAPWVEFKTDKHFSLVADQPVMLAQYLTGENASEDDKGKVAEGDPALILVPPIEQWRSDYNALTSTTMRHNYLSLVSRTPTPGIQINGKDLTAQNFSDYYDFGGIPNSGLYVFRVRVPQATGQQRITANAEVGVTVYGYDSFVSYGFLGGLNLTPLHSGIPGDGS